MNHAFVIPAYGESPHLSSCIDSILSQSAATSEVLLTTSTPSVFLNKIADKYRIPLLVNPVRDGIASDWNFALTAPNAQYVTLAHQDDYYDPRYTTFMLAAIDRHPGMLIAFSNNSEHTPWGPRKVNVNLQIKRLLSIRAFGSKEALVQPEDKRRLISLGNPICCPSVIINRGLVPDFRFADGMKSNLDWEAWSRLALMPGAFVYLKAPLVSKGVHSESETSALIANQLREQEDRQMFDRFWPTPVAAAIAMVYKLGYLANRV